MLVRGDMSGVGNVLPDFLKLCCKLDCGLSFFFVILTFLYSPPGVSGRVWRVEISEGGEKAIGRQAHLAHSPWLSSLQDKTG